MFYTVKYNNLHLIILLGLYLNLIIPKFILIIFWYIHISLEINYTIHSSLKLSDMFISTAL